MSRKHLLVFAVAIFYSLVAFNNVTDYDSNYQFVRHVLMMDSTFPGNRGMWRALNQPLWHTLFYLSIIAWEVADHGALLVGRPADVAEPSKAYGCFRRREGCCYCRADAWLTDVARGFFECRRRVVSNVAVEILERTGRSVSDVHRYRNCAATGVAAGA